MNEQIPDKFARLSDEVELMIMEYAAEESLPVLVEVAARTMARFGVMADRRFLDVLQQRTVAILTEESVESE